jgi:hypothetical protein
MKNPDEYDFVFILSIKCGSFWIGERLPRRRSAYGLDARLLYVGILAW